MNDIKLIIPPEDYIPIMYEVYRRQENPSSEVFTSCDSAKQKRIIFNMQKFFKVAVINEQYVGWVTAIDRDSDSCVNISFYLHNNFRGKGFMAEILKVHLAEVKEFKKDKVLKAGVLKNNIAAQKTLERVGFIRNSEDKSEKYLRYVYNCPTRVDSMYIN